MMNNFKISIVVPVYNSEKKIRKCIDSILSQSFTDYELILLNDGSTDYTLSILEEYEKEYNSIKVIDKLNEGIAKTRNLGISIATGKYIVFLDNDDFIDSDYLQILYDEIENTGNDIVVAGYRRVSDTKELFKVSPSKTSWAKYTVISPWAKIYRRKFIIDNNIEFLDYVIGEDVYFNLQAYTLTKKVSTISYIGYNWYDNDQSVTNTKHRGFKKEADITQLFTYIGEKIDLSSTINRYYLKRFYIYYLLFSGRTASPEAFMQEFKKINSYLLEKNLVSQLNPFNKQVSGDTFKVQLSILFFEVLKNLGLLPIFAKIYCKG